MNKQIELSILNDDLTKSYKELGNKYNLSPDQIRYVLRKNKIEKPKRYRRYSDIDIKDIEYLKDNIDNYSFTYFSQKFNVTEKVLYTLCKKLNIKKTKRIITYKQTSDWTNDELNILKNNKDIIFDDLCKLLPNRSKKAIEQKCLKLKIFLNKTGRDKSKWSKEEDDYLINNYPNLKTEQLSWFLERSFKSINHRLNYLKLNKETPNSKTSIEKKVEEILISLNLKYNYNTRLSKEYKFRPDFTMINKKLIIECQGDYWHGNPNIYTATELNFSQLISIEKDNFKKQYYEKLGYSVLELWEYDINNDIQFVKEVIKLNAC